MCVYISSLFCIIYVFPSFCCLVSSHISITSCSELPVGYLLVGYSMCHHKLRNQVMTRWKNSPSFVGLTCIKLTPSRVLQIGAEMFVSYLREATGYCQKCSLLCDKVCSIGVLKSHFTHSFIGGWFVHLDLRPGITHLDLQIKPQFGVVADLKIMEELFHHIIIDIEL